MNVKVRERVIGGSERGEEVEWSQGGRPGEKGRGLVPPQSSTYHSVIRRLLHSPLITSGT
jgi:hypothetical protein